MILPTVASHNKEVNETTGALRVEDREERMDRKGATRFRIVKGDKIRNRMSTLNVIGEETSKGYVRNGERGGGGGMKKRSHTTFLLILQPMCQDKMKKNSVPETEDGTERPDSDGWIHRSI